MMKIIKTDLYLLLIDEENRGIEYGEVGVNMRHSKLEVETRNMGGYGSDKYYWYHKKCLAYYPLTKESKELDLPLLPNPLEGDNIGSIALKAYYIDSFDTLEIPGFEDTKNCVEGFIKGYKAAQSKTSFTLEDMKKAIEMAREGNFSKYYGCMDWVNTEEEIIQSLSTQQLPKEFIPEENYGDGALTKYKTITNSEGKEELVGTYKY